MIVPQIAQKKPKQQASQTSLAGILRLTKLNHFLRGTNPSFSKFLHAWACQLQQISTNIVFQQMAHAST